MDCNQVSASADSSSRTNSGRSGPLEGPTSVGTSSDGADSAGEYLSTEDWEEFEVPEDEIDVDEIIASLGQILRNDPTRRRRPRKSQRSSLSFAR